MVNDWSTPNVAEELGEGDAKTLAKGDGAADPVDVGEIRVAPDVERSLRDPFSAATAPPPRGCGWRRGGGAPVDARRRLLPLQLALLLGRQVLDFLVLRALPTVA